MPDWTYLPLRHAAASVLGERRARRIALHSLATLVGLPGGERVARAFVHPLPSPDATRLGAVVGPDVVVDAARALPVLGGRVVRSTAGAVGAAGPVGAQGLPAGSHRTVVVDDPDVARAAAALAEPGVTVLATSGVLAGAGPGWFQLVLEAATPTRPPDGLVEAVRRGPRRWPAWLWGLVVGAGMVVAGLGAAVITLGPVLLPYDRAHLGAGTDDLLVVSPHLVGFVQHDRITMAGTMVAIGILYGGLAWGGLRRGRRWARTAYLLSGCGAFPTLLHYLVIGFFEPLHALTTVVLVPMYLAAVWQPPAQPRWTHRPDGPERDRLRAAAGQLLMVVTGFGLLVGGLVITVVGLTSVFVGTDLEFLGTDAASVAAANDRLVGFVAHDRAGFGGALTGAATAILLLAAWGWRRGERWVWWCLALGAVAGFGPTVAVHRAVGYTDLGHLAPVYLGIALTAVALWLSRPYLCARAGDVS
ncbi:MAG: hypothetical protein HY830_08315 [Actinobacteria bacterium]|nr:hypothetical protein [Actinomycetota bacterium]